MRRCLFSLLLVVLLTSTAVSFGNDRWPAERSLNNLQRVALSPESPFADWTTFAGADLRYPVLAYGPPTSLSESGAEADLQDILNSVKCYSNFDLVSVISSGQLTRNYFRETRNGLQVLSGRADIVYNSGGKIIRWSLRGHDDWPTEDGHYLSMQQAAKALSLAAPDADWTPEQDCCFAAWYPDHDRRQLRPVYWLRIHGQRPRDRWEGIVDASGGEVIHDWPGIRTEIVSGQIQGQYWQPYEDSDVQIAPHAFETLFVNDNAITTDSAGNFSRQTGTSSNLQAGLSGAYVDVSDEDAPAGQMTLHLDAPYSPVVWTWTTDSASREELNLYYHVVRIHEWYKRLDPAFSALNYPMPAQANIGDEYDNAYWNGWGIYFGSGHDLNNFAMYSDVIYHEYTHGVTDGIYPNGMLPYIDEPGAMNEAWSDYFACTINDDPLMGEHMQPESPGFALRNLLSTMVYPHDWTNEVHSDSPFISAPLWRIRQILGPGYADSLAHYARYGLSETFFDYLQDVLEVDDNNGNLADGTPHDDVIYESFGIHGIGPGILPHFVLENLHFYADGTGGSVGDGDRFFESAETIELVFRVRNEATLFPPPATDVQVTVITADGALIIENGQQSIPLLAAGGSQDMLPVRIHIPADCPDHWSSIVLSVSGSGAMIADTLSLMIGVPRVLIIEDDPGSQVEQFVANSARESGRIYDSIETTGNEPIAANALDGYGLVVWISGDARGQVLATQDQYLLQQFLAEGNKVVLSGQDIVDALDGGPFAQNVLQIDVANDSLPSQAITADAPPLTPGEWFVTAGFGGAGNQRRQTALTPIGSSTAVAHYGHGSNGPTAVVAFAQNKGLLFGFGIEGISGTIEGTQTRTELLEELFIWAADVISPVERVSTTLPLFLQMGQAYPNPFNASTTFLISVPATGAYLEIFDVLGRIVDSRMLMTGKDVFEWRPMAASGVYFARLRSGAEITKPQRLLLIR